jgi:hypothetical protein
MAKNLQQSSPPPWGVFIIDKIDDETVDRFVVEMEDVVVAVAKNALDKEGLQRVIEEIMKGSP